MGERRPSFRTRAGSIRDVTGRRAAPTKTGQCRQKTDRMTGRRDDPILSGCGIVVVRLPSKQFYESSILSIRSIYD